MMSTLQIWGMILLFHVFLFFFLVFCGLLDTHFTRHPLPVKKFNDFWSGGGLYDLLSGLFKRK